MTTSKVCHAGTTQVTSIGSLAALAVIFAACSGGGNDADSAGGGGGSVGGGGRGSSSASVGTTYTAGGGSASRGSDAGTHDGGASASDFGSSVDGSAPEGGEDAPGAAAAPGSEASVLDAPTEAGVPLAAIPLSTPDGTYYTAQVTVGDQTFAMDIDTGSATSAVAGQGCTNCTAAGVSPLYQPSFTATDLHRTATSAYGDGSSLAGEIFQDTVSLGYGSPNVQLELMSVQSDRQFFKAAQFQGILGLGSTLLELKGTDTYLAQETSAGVSPVLAFELCATRGTLWLGGFDASAAASPVQYTPLIPVGKTTPYYAINVDDVLMGGTSLGLQAADFESPIVDTGTSLFYLPTRVFNAILRAINTSSGYTSLFGRTPLRANGCAQSNGAMAATVDAALPAMAVNLPSNVAGAQDLTLTVSPTQSYLIDAGQGQFCLAVGDGGTMQGGAILGDAFLSSFVTIIDRQNGQVGFATDMGCGSILGRRLIDLATWHPRAPRPRR